MGALQVAVVDGDVDVDVVGILVAGVVVVVEEGVILEVLNHNSISSCNLTYFDSGYVLFNMFAGRGGRGRGGRGFGEKVPLSGSGTHTHTHVVIYVTEIVLKEVFYRQENHF